MWLSWRQDACGYPACSSRPLHGATFVADRAQAEAHLLLFHIDLDDLEFELLTLIELSRGAVFTDCLRDMAQAFNALCDFYESAELRGAKHFAMDHVADAMRGEEALPDIRLKLLDAEAWAAVLRLDTENNGLDLLALLVTTSEGCLTRLVQLRLET